MNMTAGRAALVLLFVAALAAPYHAAQDDAAEKARAGAQKAFDEGMKRANPDHYREAIERFQKAHDLAKSVGETKAQAQALQKIGEMYQVYGKDAAKALDAYQRALDAARASGDQPVVASTLEDVATAYKLLENYTKSVEAYTEALAIYTKLEDHAAEASTVRNIAGVYSAAGDQARSDEFRAKAAELRTKYNLPPLTIRVSGGVLASKAISRPQPSFSPEAMRGGVTGSVVVEVTVSTEGKVESARVISGPPEHHSECLRAARGWKFEPILLSGEPVRMIGTITFNFRKS